MSQLKKIMRDRGPARDAPACRLRGTTGDFGPKSERAGTERRILERRAHLFAPYVLAYMLTLLSRRKKRPKALRTNIRMSRAAGTDPPSPLPQARKFALRLPKVAAGLYRVPCPPFSIAVIAMPFLLLLCPSLACLPVLPAPLLGRSPTDSLIAGITAMGVVIAYVTTVTWRTRRRLRTRPDQREQWLFEYGRARTRFTLLAMALFVLV